MGWWIKVREVEWWEWRGYAGGRRVRYLVEILISTIGMSIRRFGDEGFNCELTGWFMNSQGEICKLLEFVPWVKRHYQNRYLNARIRTLAVHLQNQILVLRWVWFVMMCMAEGGDLVIFLQAFY